MAALPTEIIAEILSQLPVKSLLRFRCVCKSWYFLIKTPNFVKIHLDQTIISNSDRHLLLYYPRLDSAELDQNLVCFSEVLHPLEPQAVHLFGSCNGIICIADLHKTDIFLFNPLTKSHYNLPLNQILNLKVGYMLFGFGYDSKNDDYKILRLVQGFTKEKVFYSEAQMYSLNNNSWKSVQGISSYLLFSDCHGVLVNEALHFLANSEELGLTGEYIASFDLQTESFSLMDCSKFVHKIGNYLMILLAQLGGCLCALVNNNTNFILEGADLWVMKEYENKESWVRLYSIGQECIQSRVQIKPIVYSVDGKRVLLQIDSLKFGWYDLESENVEMFTPQGLPDGSLETESFLGSLVSLEDKHHSDKETSPRQNKNDVDSFLSSEFKLIL
ncbi:hypothetical protein SOVF_176530 [Spinacia oleracea]|uniref:F-box protein CPR1 isoform X2 n=1 Tax=Spinacia oleracea TaxID=3562 RepID=A0ABM3RW58_SPIOL|nr:F-box protein CPR1-like isoform X2 [Spinacia oleracea]XP_056699847.1 F-box protein CPR1-like isoform X2 [Spinacia oleracea]KNA06933.1 hypothetical protein SOVF_176530 [Spinacia oleracea]